MDFRGLLTPSLMPLALNAPLSLPLLHAPVSPHYNKDIYRFHAMLLKIPSCSLKIWKVLLNYIVEIFHENTKGCHETLE